MNEQITQLMKQAGTDSSGKWMDADHAQKFAELIIEECARESDKQTIYCRGIPWGKWIKEHFGVKE